MGGLMTDKKEKPKLPDESPLRTVELVLNKNEPAKKKNSEEK
jgi:hypothetical protein